MHSGSGPPPSDEAPPASANPAGATTSRTHRKPFSSLMKRLAGLKTSHHNSSSAAHNSSAGKATGLLPGQIDTTLHKSNSGPSGTSKSHSGKHRSNSHPGIPTPLNTTSTVNTITGPSYDDLKNHQQSHSTGSSSATSSPSAPKPSNHTITTTATSLKSPSTFSSPAPSVRSLTTTLTTIQSTAPNLGNGATPYHNYNPHASHHHNPYAASVLYNNPLPSPSHLHPSANTTGGNNHQVYYSTATANGILTDNASIITLASSSKRRRRHSFDTDASIRALAPASVWGGSRESLPLSVLSSLDSGDRDRERSTRIPGDRSSLYGRLAADGSSVRGIHSPSLHSPISGPETGSVEYFLQGKENYSVVGGGGAAGHAGVGGAGSTQGAWSGARSRRGSGWGEVHTDGDEERRRRDKEDEDDDDGTSVRSRRSGRTASIASGKTGRTEEEGEVGESGVIAVGSTTAPVVLNKVPGGEKGKGKM